MQHVPKLDLRYLNEPARGSNADGKESKNHLLWSVKMSVRLRKQALRGSKRSLMGQAGSARRIYLPTWVTTWNLCLTYPTSSSSSTSRSNNSLMPTCLSKMSSWSPQLTLMDQASKSMLGLSLRKRGTWLISSACFIKRHQGHWLMKSAMRLRRRSQFWWGRESRKLKIVYHS